MNKKSTLNLMASVLIDDHEEQELICSGLNKLGVNYKISKDLNELWNSVVSEPPFYYCRC